MTKLTNIARYPVKSMGGESLTTTFVDRLGIPGDRSWAVRDEERGGIRGGKRFPALMSCRAQAIDVPTSANRSVQANITLPSGQVVGTTDHDINPVLSEVVGSPVTLWPLLPADALDHYKRGEPDNSDLEAYLREVFARTPDEALPDLSKFSAEVLNYATPPGTYFDAFPLLIMTNASLAAIQDCAPNSKMDVRRFRPNLIIATDQTGFVENDWVGKRLQIGSAIFNIEMTCPRCVMTTHAFDELPKDPQIMRALVANNQGDLGVYAKVIEAGSINVNDEAILL